MADERRSQAGTAVLAGGSAALGVALALLLRGKEAQAAPDDATLALLQSIAQSGVSVDTDTSDIIAILNGIAAKLGAPGAVTLENPSEITTFQVTVPVAFANPQQLPDRAIPYDKELVIKAMPGNQGQIWVANSRTEALSANSVYILIANEAIEYKIKNAGQIWINATRAGEGVLCTAEKVGL